MCQKQESSPLPALEKASKVDEKKSDCDADCDDDRSLDLFFFILSPDFTPPSSHRNPANSLPIDRACAAGPKVKPNEAKRKEQ